MVSPQFSDNKELDEVDQLLLNARLRDALEPFQDESFDLVNVQGMPTSFENEYLASMLAWEQAPYCRLPNGSIRGSNCQLPTRSPKTHSTSCCGIPFASSTKNRSCSISPTTWQTTSCIV